MNQGIFANIDVALQINPGFNNTVWLDFVVGSRTELRLRISQDKQHPARSYWIPPHSPFRPVSACY
jgi:hypothetical protein